MYCNFYIYIRFLLLIFWSLLISNWMVIYSFWIWRRRGKWDSYVNGIVFRVRFFVNWVLVIFFNNVGEGGERKKKKEFILVEYDWFNSVRVFKVYKWSSFVFYDFGVYIGIKCLWNLIFVWLFILFLIIEW